MVIPRQCRQCAVTQPERQVARGQQCCQHPDAVGQQLVQHGGPEQRKQQKIHQHRARVEHRELQQPAQERAFYAVQLDAQHGVIPHDQHVKQRQFGLRHKEDGQNCHADVEGQRVACAVFLQHRDEQERRQHRRGIGADLQCTAQQQKHHRKRPQHTAEGYLLAFRFAHRSASHRFSILVHYTLFCFTLQ